PMSASLVLSLPEDVAVTARDEGELVFQSERARITLRQLAPENVLALRRLAPPGETEDRLADAVQQAGGAEALARFYYHLGQLDRRGLLHRSVFADGAHLATLTPTSRHFVFPARALAAGRHY